VLSGGDEFGVAALRYLLPRRANQGIAPLAGVVLVGMSLMLLTSARAQSV
jgi:hypothetical protein